MCIPIWEWYHSSYLTIILKIKKKNIKNEIIKKKWFPSQTLSILFIVKHVLNLIKSTAKSFNRFSRSPLAKKQQLPNKSIRVGKRTKLSKVFVKTHFTTDIFDLLKQKKQSCGKCCLRNRAFKQERIAGVCCCCCFFLIYFSLNELTAVFYGWQRLISKNFL